MDWSQTNDSNASNWQQRRSEDNFIQTRETGSLDEGQGGMAWELLIAAANESQSNAWINIPHLADDNYIRELAELWQANLNPGLKVIVEFSNEIWNTRFDQYDETNSADFYGVVAPKLIQIRNEFAKAFGPESDRFEVVLAGQAGRPRMILSLIHI